MTGWLLDTNVVSRLAPGKDGRPKLEGRFSEWLGDKTDSLFLSAITVLEVVAGIEKLRRAGATRQASDLDVWLVRIVALYGERVLPLDVDVAKAAGALADQAPANRRHGEASPPRALMTDTLKLFEPLNLTVPAVNPFGQPVSDDP